MLLRTLPRNRLIASWAKHLNDKFCLNCIHDSFHVTIYCNLIVCTITSSTSTFVSKYCFASHVNCKSFSKEIKIRTVNILMRKGMGHTAVSAT